MLITIDPYYTVSEYNQCLSALKNNRIDYVEYISTKPPYNWVLDVPSEPIMTNFDKVGSSLERFLVRKVIPVNQNDSMKLYRRNDSKGNGIIKYICNTPLLETENSDTGVFFTIRNREEGIKLSRDYPGKIWYLGKYFGNRYKLCLVSSGLILAYLSEKQVLLSKTKGTFTEPGSFEAYLNYKVFLNQDKLVKFTQTPYFSNGEFVKPNYLIDDKLATV